jgi:hypothetical protein
METKVNEFWEYVNFNYVMIEHYIELKSFYSTYIETVLFSYSLNEKPQKTDRFFPFMAGNISKLDKLNYFHLYIMVNHIKFEDLSKLLNTYNIKSINVDSQVIKRLIKSFINLINSITKLDVPGAYYINSIIKLSLPGNYYNLLDNILIVFSRLNVEKIILER